MPEKRALVLGGGVAGATVAVALAEAGVAVTLAEKDDYLGGHAALLACKALGDCQKCNGCLTEPRLAALGRDSRVEVLRRCQATAMKRAGTRFSAKLTQRPAYINPARCSGCGLCLERCPASGDGALRRPLVLGDPPPLAIDPGVCLFFRDGRSALCRDICPEEAIDFGLSAREMERTVEAVVLATGFRPYPAEEKQRLGYGSVPNVVTALELEVMLRERGRPTRPSDGQMPRRVAFIQCVGSRDRLGHNYCSRVCCGYALRLGRTLKQRHGAEVSVFHMDLQGFNNAAQPDLENIGRELNLVRSMPYDVLAAEGGQVYLEYQASSGAPPVRKFFDLVVLSIGITPNLDNLQLAGLWDVAMDDHGFLLPAPGVFVAGTAGRPLDVAETVAAAGRTALEAARYMEAL
jgi:heterodisulfide reductase subunit A